MSASAEVRSLRAMVSTASTARVMNLARRHGGAGPRHTPKRALFANTVLDRAILVKHRVRPHERDAFVSPPSVATKVLIPIDPADLQVGAHSFFVGQRGVGQVYAELLGVALGDQEHNGDLKVLAALDELPTLDPFLTREHLKRRGIVADDDYFEISPSDVARMFQFVEQNIVPLVDLCFRGSGAASGAQAQRLAQKILAADLDATMDPLRLTLKMNEEQFLEGIFCWKGFLYYKWVLNDCVRLAHDVAGEIESVRLRGKATAEEQAYIQGARERLQTGIKKACREVKATLDRYDQAFEALTQRADPMAFREFLIAAPDMFFGVGDRLGAIQHITSFWRYRFRKDAAMITAPELLDIFVDFESGLGLAGERQDRW